ncbi:hypothetical protein EON66_06560 [archaeon]|nr:MAG: hypothetical protein EON66_06560 [archaeon]
MVGAALRSTATTPPPHPPFTGIAPLYNPASSSAGSALLFFPAPRASLPTRRGSVGDGAEPLVHTDFAPLLATIQAACGGGAGQGDAPPVCHAIVMLDVYLSQKVTPTACLRWEDVLATFDDIRMFLADAAATLDGVPPVAWVYVQMTEVWAAEEYQHCPPAPPAVAQLLFSTLRNAFSRTKVVVDAPPPFTDDMVLLDALRWDETLPSASIVQPNATVSSARVGSGGGYEGSPLTWIAVNHSNTSVTTADALDAPPLGYRLQLSRLACQATFDAAHISRGVSSCH